MRREKAIFDNKKHDPSYKEGNLVFLRLPVCSQGLTPKFNSFWSGPHCIKKINQIKFALQDVKNQKRLLITIALNFLLRQYSDCAENAPANL